MFEKLLIEADGRMRALEKEVFNSPPVDMLDFNRRLGSWIELSKTRDWIAEWLRQQDIDEEDQS